MTTPEQCQEIVRSKGLCGELSPDRKRTCILLAATQHRHDWNDAVDVAIDCIYETDRVVPVLPPLPFEAARFLRHAYNCDYLQPMWHKGPCDCGLHELTDTFSPELKARLCALYPDDREFHGDPYGLFRRVAVENAP